MQSLTNNKEENLLNKKNVSMKNEHQVIEMK